MTVSVTNGTNIDKVYHGPRQEMALRNFQNKTLICNFMRQKLPQPHMMCQLGHVVTVTHLSEKIVMRNKEK